MITRDSATDLIKQELLFCGTEFGKLSTMRTLISTGQLLPPALIFVQAVERATDLYNQLVSSGIKVDFIHSDRSKKQRDEIINRFARGELWVLISTDVMARGVDFKGVNLVIKSGLSFRSQFASI